RRRPRQGAAPGPVAPSRPPRHSPAPPARATFRPAARRGERRPGGRRAGWYAPTVATTRARSHAPWSASKISTALRCSRLFHYRYVEKLPEPEVMPEARIGKAVHAALEGALGGAALPAAIEQGRKLLTDPLEQARFDHLSRGIPPFLDRIEAFRRRRRVARELVEFSLAVREDFSTTQFYAGDAFYRGIF